MRERKSESVLASRQWSQQLYGIIGPWCSAQIDHSKCREEEEELQVRSWTRSCNSPCQMVRMIVPNFKEKGVFFQAWARTSKFKEKGCFLGKKSAIFVKQVAWPWARMAKLPAVPFLPLYCSQDH